MARSSASMPVARACMRAAALAQAVTAVVRAVSLLRARRGPGPPRRGRRRGRPRSARAAATACSDSARARAASARAASTARSASARAAAAASSLSARAAATACSACARARRGPGARGPAPPRRSAPPGSQRRGGVIGARPELGGGGFGARARLPGGAGGPQGAQGGERGGGEQDGGQGRRPGHGGARGCGRGDRASTARAAAAAGTDTVAAVSRRVRTDRSEVRKTSALRANGGAEALLLGKSWSL